MAFALWLRFLFHRTRVANQLKVDDGMWVGLSQLICLFSVDLYHRQNRTRVPNPLLIYGKQPLKLNANVLVYAAWKKCYEKCCTCTRLSEHLPKSPDWSLFTGSWPVMSCQPASIHYGQLTHGYITHTQCCTPRNMSFSQRRGEWGGYSRQADRKKKEIVKEGIFIVVPLPTTCNMGNMNEERTGSPS